MKDRVAPEQLRESRRSDHYRDQESASTLLFSNSSLLAVSPKGGGVTVNTLRLVDDGLTLGSVVSAGHEVALEDPDCVTLLLPTQGRIVMWTAQDDHGYDRGSVVLVRAEKRRTRVIPPPGGAFTATTVLVPRSRLSALSVADPQASRRSAGKVVLPITSTLGRGVGKLLPTLAADVFRQHDRLLTQRAIAEFVAMIDDLLVDATGPGDTGLRCYAGLREFQRVSRACDMIQARSDEALSIATLAAELEVVPRTLQISFQAVHGISPRQYLERVRLDRVREMILSQGDGGSVTSAALDCGFLHLGRFSQAYRRTFGELPSETHARRRLAPARSRTHQSR